MDAPLRMQPPQILDIRPLPAPVVLAVPAVPADYLLVPQTGARLSHIRAIDAGYGGQVHEVPIPSVLHTNLGRSPILNPAKYHPPFSLTFMSPSLTRVLFRRLSLAK